jgi:hypothetical protein
VGAVLSLLHLGNLFKPRLDDLSAVQSQKLASALLFYDSLFQLRFCRDEASLVLGHHFIDLGDNSWPLVSHIVLLGRISLDIEQLYFWQGLYICGVAIGVVLQIVQLIVPLAGRKQLGAMIEKHFVSWGHLFPSQHGRQVIAVQHGGLGQADPRQFADGGQAAICQFRRCDDWPASRMGSLPVLVLLFQKFLPSHYQYVTKY